MKKKILVLVVGLLVLSMTLTPFALARPWNEKNNEKFLDYNVVIGFDWDAVVFNVEPIPPADPNKLVLTWDEIATSDYTITVDGIGTYTCGTDFDYSGVAVLTAIGAPFNPNPFNFPTGTKQNMFRVDFMYNFSAYANGIEGTLEMLAISAQGMEGVMHITSLRGTGDLQNVKVFATGLAPGHDG